MYILLPISLGMALIAVGGFIWASRRKQFDDLETPAHRVLLGDDEPKTKTSKSNPTNLP